MQTHSTDFPGNYPGYDDTWSQEKFEEDNAVVGDDFMNQIQPIAAYVPYMTCPGNHEYAYNFSNYKNRFSMPGNTENIYYR
ncbi:Iron/zinc purple acid phosphatase-like protein [Stylophora pistillata]|uniref:Iron/zinc purple acid phosphatase-like protein n=1 Tax=Stylophora pistillata TaxID=50429 RepID=A0A2B4RQS7_STYPI|nr:Iron/zinc purple acid phosphatase-like protein [Stylophora pistillata]